MTEYLRYFIREEKMKQNAGADNADVIRGLEDMVTKYTREADLMKKTLASQSTATSNATDLNSVSDINEIFELAKTLYGLPINGRSIQQQVEALKRLQTETKRLREEEIELPACAASSIIMRQLQGIVTRDSYANAGVSELLGAQKLFPPVPSWDTLVSFLIIPYESVKGSARILIQQDPRRIRTRSCLKSLHHLFSGFNQDHPGFFSGFL